MLALIVECHVVVQRGVHAAGAQAVGDGPEAQHPEGATDGEAKQRQCRGGDTDGRDLPGAQLPGDPVALEAGDDGAQGDDHGDGPGIGDRHAQLRIHAGPGRAQQGIRQAEADKGQIDDDQQKMNHSDTFFGKIERNNLKKRHPPK